MTSPYDTMPAVPEFTVTSADTADGVALQAAQFAAMSGAPGAEDRSPQLSWNGFPAATRSFAVTMYDPDAPTPALGFSLARGERRSRAAAPGSRRCSRWSRRTAV